MPVNNIFKGFRQPGTPLTFGLTNIDVPTKRYDEPTYLAFSVNFYPKFTEINTNTNFDKMAMPLFLRGSAGADDYNARTNYSTYNYLRDINEFQRANLLRRFIDNWNQIQYEFQWYFQAIDGLDSILKVNPGRGRRVGDDARLTFTMLEGLDQRITNTLTMYRKIAWDDVYQRWILPDMMRYFAMDIFITEFRTFHQSSIGNAANLQGDGPNESGQMVLQVLQNTMPTWTLECERCEFDVETVNNNISSLNVNEPEMLGVQFDIKVGNVKERYSNPALDIHFTDRIVNGFERSQELEVPESDRVAAGTAPGNRPEDNERPFDPLRVSGNTRVYANSSLSAQFQLLNSFEHVPGTPFNESGNVNNLKNASPNAQIDSDSIDPTQPSTWFGNAVTFGKAFASNFVEDAVDKAKMTKIPNLGISINEAIAAVESKNFVTAFGLIRQAINKTYELSAAPSSLLGQEIVDGTFRQFLEGVTKSEATDVTVLEAQQFADLLLSDRGSFERLRDFSLATDLLGPDEVNIPNPIDNKNDFATQVAIQTDNDLSKATDLTGEIEPIQGRLLQEGTPSSSATTNKIQG